MVDIKEKSREDEQHLPEPTIVRRLLPDNTMFEETDGGMLNVFVEGYRFERVAVHESFPHTDPSRYISIRTRENKEIGLIENLSDFPQDQIDILIKQIKNRYFAPIILKIINVKDEFGFTHWAVETNCGECRFTVRGGGGSVIHPTGNKYIITDVDGNRFIIPDTSKFSTKEFKMIDIYL